MLCFDDASVPSVGGVLEREDDLGLLERAIVVSGLFCWLSASAAVLLDDWCEVVVDMLLFGCVFRRMVGLDVD